jgi:hypothetical protein
MRHCLVLLTLLAAVGGACSQDNYDTLTRSVIRCVVSRDSAGLAALVPAKTFRYFINDVKNDRRLLNDTRNFMVRPDGYFSYEKKFRTVAARDAVTFLTSDCGANYNRAKYPVAESDFSQVNIMGKNRVEIVCRALCGMDGVHLVFVKDGGKKMWGYAGVWWEKIRLE